MTRRMYRRVRAPLSIRIAGTYGTEGCLDSSQAHRLPSQADPRHLLASGQCTLLAVANRYYDGDVQAAKADLYRGKRGAR